MNDYFLILYVGNDYSVPIIDSLKGDMYAYRQGDDNRLWLYFHEETDTTDVTFGRENFRYSMMDKESYFGRYWENVSVEKTVSQSASSPSSIALTEAEIASSQSAPMVISSKLSFSS